MNGLYSVDVEKDMNGLYSVDVLIKVYYYMSLLERSIKTLDRGMRMKQKNKE